MRTLLTSLLALVVLAGAYGWSARAGDGKSIEERLASFEKRLAAIEAKILAVEVWDKNRGIAETQMANFGSAIDNYRMINKKLPSSLEDLTKATDREPEPLLRSIPKDPWGNAYEYRATSNREYTIRSHGEDGQPDTDDDIVWPRIGK